MAHVLVVARASNIFKESSTLGRFPETLMAISQRRHVARHQWRSQEFYMGMAMYHKKNTKKRVSGCRSAVQ